MSVEKDDTEFTLDEEVFERALKDIQENQELYDSFTG